MSDTHAGEVLTTQDGKPLKAALAKALRREKLRALALIAPLLIFVLLTFVAPIVDMLFRSVENGIVEDTLPKTVIALQEWDPTSGNVPDEVVFAALYDDLVVAVEEKTHTRLGSRLNYEETGVSSLFRKTGRGVKRMDEAGPYKEQFIDLDKDWGNVETWQVLKRFSPRYTAGYFLNAFDAQQTANGIELKPEDERIYMFLFGRTLFLSIAITVSCLLLGYPIAFLLSALPLRSSNLLMILVLLPFWTSLLVRTSAWKVLLQQQGVINDFLVWTGIISDAGRLVMINNQTGTIIAMTHILLPFMILPLYSVMKTISPSYVRAAKSLGANDWTAFWRVYFPQTVPGIGAGAVLVFILSIGYYITPELVGGTSGIFISNRIAYHISSSLNWGLGAALGTLLLVAVLVLFVVYDKIVGIDNVKLG
ncbi:MULTISPECIES: ABC transporter permease [Stappiaceae]|jgi:putative spermidine/putrescine transport system permease protein|uniref:Spermidine/putrescine transport system permease protein PotB n=2 Tax=Roseibium TaxID=150830 RepID=A0A0M6Y3E3_9HYPH|nr:MULTISPECIES: ABC transporter permease [Stappiaceae]MCR9283475.1 ABC transporter permease subunit [Paracoccaceae bacterium]MEC9419533.1 ABC transporter permease subunit [Pseudomonadota bacterium]AQQ03994.1 ABC transporter permease [Roseibium aggregatum]ERP97397.1 polyamine ABC transporter substrate-binding protein [Labrenzia sp. C1B10]ERS08922.1 polyamine ABC transporter substrate-binding protein [Labrenzia sp. C1B70]